MTLMLEAPVDTTTARKAAPPTWLVVAAACAGQFLVVLDVSVVNVALPSMRADLGLSATGLQWVVNAYSIAFAGFMLLGGRAGDLFGRKRMFLVGLGLFTLASLAGGLAQEGWQLLAARAVQGLGAAVLAPSTLTILTSAVPEGAARARAIATWTAVGAGGGAAGGLVGGVLTEGLDWRWVLLINVPLGALVFTAAARWIQESKAGGERRLDLPGAVLVTAGTATLAYGVVQTEAEGWGAAATLIPLGVALALIVTFLAVEARTRLPLMPLGLFRVRAVAAANAAMFVCGMGSFAMWFFMTLYAQNVLGYTPIEAGLALVPSSLAVVAGSKIAPRLMRRAGARAVAVSGVLVTTAGFTWQSTMSSHGGYVTAIMLPGMVMMAGAGLAMTPLASLATSGAAPGDAGLVSGLVNTSRTLGGSLGLAILSTVAAGRSGGGTGAQDLTDGYAAAFRWGAGILLVAVVLLVTWMPRAKESRQTVS
ncbi:MULTISPECIES: DHA2 family efflux MFS transporter permease subunit [unclassified Streptomyces]|uniref:DHA2 family efflux MFS transporter permease subunit n=1 Tax=unclassified Streptomyces TaxID=2593676 RepID=UPI0022595157|nr:MULTISPECIES: DHA2 family efflux MFS transporter permease subunit [unclassified Streptomyces]MCX5437017.1 DHA2 family efflux MFS transporter permease subunit [Streptomyces sp. NBC_00063]WSE14743.1 DHA2 family efflux MFS transporter permease subunit [Streptomyces sp. NBC_01397]WUB96342.1 DHA2 family efflux MFS transporter permease subunit [Streptomyces sp. NBC_00569]